PGRPARRVSWVARVVAPLALIAVIIAVVVIVGSSGNEDPGATTTGPAAAKSESKEGPETPRTYTVQAGDSLTSVADKFGVSIKRLQRLNPDVDPQALGEGTPLTLR
ncbi:MAG: LysM domain-containing protein, partial [Solirubrobacterales bacterium]